MARPGGRGGSEQADGRQGLKQFHLSPVVAPKSRLTRLRQCSGLPALAGFSVVCSVDAPRANRLRDPLVPGQSEAVVSLPVPCHRSMIER